MASKLASTLLLLCFSLVLASLASALQLQDAHYSVKEAPLLGNTYKYAIFEAQFDEELHLMNQWPVACVDVNHTCGASAGQVGPFVDETMFYPDGSRIPVSELTEGVWLNSSIMNTYDSQFIKFNVPYDSSRPCPYITIEWQSHVGTMAYYVSSKYIPSPAKYIWSHGFYSPTSLVITPTHSDFVYGNYYIQVSNQAGRVANIFAIRFTVSNSPACPVQPTVDYATLPVSTGTWLEDGVMTSYQASPPPTGSTFNYKLYAPGTCTKFSVAVYKGAASTSGETVILVSANAPGISVTNTANVMWTSSMTPSDDRVNVHYCNPNTSATYNIFYIALYVAGATGRFDVVATTEQYQPSLAISQLAFSQYRLDMAFGAFPRLTCDSAIHTCTYFAFKGCENLGIGCCTIFQPISPTDGLSQALWPWNTADISLGNFHTAIPWTDMTPLVPGKVSWSMLMEWTDAEGERHVVTVADPSTCNVTIGNVFTDQDGTPLSTSKPISFEPAPVKCNYERFKELSAKAADLSSGFSTLNENVHSLALQQLKLAMVTWDPVFDACESLVESLITIPVTFESDNVTLCTKKAGTSAWTSDPCCNPLLKTTLSCRPTPVLRSVEGVGSLNDNALETRCANPQCSSAEAQAYLEQRGHIKSASEGCMQAFNRQASLDRSDELLAFTYECKEEIQGADLEGKVCATDADCVNGASCNMTFKRCEHTVDDVIDCMANRVDADTALNLFIGWGIFEKPDIVRLREEFKNRWVKDVCTGPNALKYRQGFHYTLVDPTLPDSCTFQGLEPFCVDISKSRSPSCLIPTVCDKTVVSSASFRFWQPVYEDDNSCSNSKICNWRSDSFYPCPDSFTGDCESRCVNASMGHICLDCSKSIHGTCLQVTSITSQARCDQGLCSADPAITDPQACAATGTCQNVANCPTCTDAPTCESHGLCSDYTDFKTQIDGGRTGVCVRPGTWTGTAYNCGAGRTLTTIGCANFTSANPTECATWTGGQPSRWVNFATDQATCTSNAGYSCYSTSSNLFFPRTQTECAACTDCVWKPYYSWTDGVWVPGTMQELVWEETKYYGAAKVQPAVDYSIVNTDVESAITKDFSFAYYTDALCRLDGVDSLISTIVCDCSTSNKDCFTDRSRSTVGSVNVCPYQAKQLETLVGNLTVSDTAVPRATECHIVSISSTAVGKYQVPPDHSVTHALFKKIEKNPYLIVVNDKDGIVGQLISDAATVDFSFTPEEPLKLCIPPADFIQIDSAATLYTLARLQDDNSIQVFDGGIEMSAPSGTVIESVCGLITEPGTYFAVAVSPNYRTVNPRPSSETIAACCIYLALVVFALIQLLLLVLDRVKQKLLVFKIVAIVIIIINAAIRVLYLLKSDFGKGTESIQFIIFELPTFLYFSVFTVIVYLWIIVVVSTRHFGKKTALDQKSIVLRTVFILVNVFMYAIFVVFIYLIAILPGSTKTSPCFLGNLDSAITSVEKSIKIAYWIFQLVVCILLCVGFVVASVGLLRIVVSLRKRDLGRKEATGKAKKKANAADVQMIIITIVALVCVIFLLVRSIMFLDAAVNGSTIHVIAFCMLEVVPQTMLMFYIHPFRCFTEAGRSSSTKHSGSGTGKSTYSGVGTRSRSRSAAPNGDESEEMQPSRAGDPGRSSGANGKAKADLDGEAPFSNGHHANGHQGRRLQKDNDEESEEPEDETTSSTDDSN